MITVWFICYATLIQGPVQEIGERKLVEVCQIHNSYVFLNKSKCEEVIKQLPMKCKELEIIQ